MKERLRQNGLQRLLDWQYGILARKCLSHSIIAPRIWLLLTLKLHGTSVERRRKKATIYVDAIGAMITCGEDVNTSITGVTLEPCIEILERLMCIVNHV